jgi:hypothetical protein
VVAVLQNLIVVLVAPLTANSMAVAQAAAVKAGGKWMSPKRMVNSTSFVSRRAGWLRTRLLWTG